MTTQQAKPNPAAGKYYDHDDAYARKRAKGWTGWDRQFDASEVELFIAAGLLRDGQRVLNPGCGAGQEAIFAARAGCLVDAFDASPTAIEMALDNAALEGSRVAGRTYFWCADALAPSRLLHAEHHGKYDVVLDIHLLHCLVAPQDRQEFLAFVHASLDPGGTLLSANMCGLPNTRALLDTVRPGTCISLDGRRYFAEEAEVRAELALVGFEVVHWNRRRDPGDVDYLLFGARKT